MASTESQPPDPPTPSELKAKKSDKATVLQRVQEVLELRLRGALPYEIIQHGSKKGWGVSDRQIYKYIHQSDAILVEQLDKKRKPLLARHIVQRQQLFSLAMSLAENSADCRAALAILTDEAKLRGLYPDSKETRELLKMAEAMQREIEELKRRSENATRPGETSAAGNAHVEAGGGQQAAGDPQQRPDAPAASPPTAPPSNPG